MTLSPSFAPVLKRFEFVPEWADDFLALFPHRAAYLWAEHPAPEERPQWKTEERHLLSDRLLKQGAYLYGVRFGKTTNYLMLDIDARSAYHPQHDPFAIPRMMEALEPLGLYKYIAVSSSYSEGIHLYFPFLMGQTSWAIAQAVAVLLESKGLKVDRGQLELFPNARRMSGADYNGHRLPLQAGSYLLNQDFQPIYGTQEDFVRRWQFAQSHNCLTQQEVNHVLKCFERKATKRLGVSAQKFLNDLNAEIEPGWSSFGQTNRILGAIARREYIFHHALYGGAPLKGLNLQLRILQVAMNLPGYEQWCRHHHDLHHLAVVWSRSIELSLYYPYRGEAVMESEHAANSLPTWNEQRALDARERIRLAVTELMEQGQFPEGIRARLFALKQYHISADTLYKNKDLWHPEYVEKQPEPLPEAVIQADREEQAEVRSLEPLLEGVIRAIGPISLCSCLEGAPSEQPSSSTETEAVGESEGFSTGSPTPLPGSSTIKALINRIAHENQRRQTLPLPDEVVPDEHYFQQLEVALWRE